MAPRRREPTRKAFSRVLIRPQKFLQNDWHDFPERFEGEEEEEDEDFFRSSSSDLDDSRRVRDGELERPDSFRCRELGEVVLASVPRVRSRAESSSCLISRR